MPEQHRVLLVDDDPLFRQATRLVLESEGYNVSSAGSAEEGLALMRAEKPDLVILDVMMDSVLDGVYVSQSMSEDAELRDIPVIMVSAIASTDYAAQFPQDRSLHAVDFLFKPVQPADLLASVQRFVK
jgi:CheY-like chemotaxis protein